MFGYVGDSLRRKATWLSSFVLCVVFFGGMTHSKAEVKSENSQTQPSHLNKATALSHKVFRKQSSLFQKGLRLFELGRYDKAEVVLQQAMNQEPSHEGIRYYLARTYIRLARKAQKLHHLAKQRALLKQALEVDPRLLEDNNFVQRYRQLQVATKGQRAMVVRKQKPRKSPKLKLFSLGVGLTFGVEGLMGIQTGLLIGGMVNPLVTFSPIQQSFDFTLKIIPLRRFNWSPYLSVGVTLPTSNTAHSPFPAFPDPFFHFAIGVQYHSPIGFAFSSGLSLSYHLGETNSLSFIPIPSAHISWYF